MIEVSREVPAPPDVVFRVLADGWTYPAWVVGNTRVRHVDPGWPDVGTRIHHSTGAWPCQVHDVTTVRAVLTDRMIELDARVWVLGGVIVRFTLTPLPGDRTRIVMAEQAVRGWLGLVPSWLQGFAWRARNRETLSRLADLVAARAGDG